MSNQTFRDIKFKNVDSEVEEFIRVNQDFDEKDLNKKIVDFVGGINYDKDKFTIHSFSGVRMGLKDIYSALDEDQPIKVKLISSGD